MKIFRPMQRLSRGAATVATLRWAWSHRGTVVRAVDLAGRTPRLVKAGRTGDLATELKAIAALDAEYAADTSVRLAGVGDGAITLREDLPAKDLPQVREVLLGVDQVLDIREGAATTPATAGG